VPRAVSSIFVFSDQRWLLVVHQQPSR